MRLLLDTHIWLWSHLDPDRLARRVIKELENPANELFLSPISVWEVLTLCGKGRLTLNPDPQSWIDTRLEEVRLGDAPITREVAQESGRLNLPHRDPADHFLVATAKVFDLVLVTADQALLSVADLSVLPNS